MRTFHPSTCLSYVQVVEIPKDEIRKIDFMKCKEPRQTLGDFYKEQEDKPNLLMNAGFFGMSSGEPCMTLIDDKIQRSMDTSLLDGCGTLDDKKELIFSTFGSEQWTDFISGYPVLMKNGKPTTISIAQEINYNARRSILAENDENIYLIAIELPGMNFKAMQSLLTDLKIKNAINLDGGGSTKILKDGISITSSSYNRAVDNVIAIYLVEEPVEEQKIYRVQTGAFSIKSNAEKLLAQIKSIPDTINAGYAKAYVRYVNGLYKVQVGAFSVKANAEKVVLDLKKNGFDSFITT